jgi:predicted nucleic acid-binding protein
MAIDVDALVKRMAEAARDVFDKDWPEIKELAETELKGIAEGIALIERLRLEGKISQKQARLLIRMKKNTAQIVLLTIKGLGIIAVEKAINAALKVVKDTVNEALDFRLL